MDINYVMEYSSKSFTQKDIELIQVIYFLVNIRKVWAFPSKPPISPNIPFNFASPEWPNGEFPKSCAKAPASTTYISEASYFNSNAIDLYRFC